MGKDTEQYICGRNEAIPPYAFILQSVSEQEKLNIVLSLTTPTPFLYSPPALSMHVCVPMHTELSFSYHNPPSWKTPHHKRIAQSSSLKCPRLPFSMVATLGILSKLSNVGNKMDYHTR